MVIPVIRVHCVTLINQQMVIILEHYFGPKAAIVDDDPYYLHIVISGHYNLALKLVEFL